jgi:DNA helicase HerA-like ATPase
MNYLSDNAKEFSVYSKTENLIIPYWMLNFETLCKLLGFAYGNIMSPATDIFRDRILQMKKKHVEGCYLKDKININDIDVNSPIPFSIKEIWFEFYSRGYGTFKEVSRIPPNYAYEEKDDVELKGDAETLEKPQFKEYTTDRTAPYKSNETYFRNIADNILSMLNNDDFKFMFGDHKFIKDTENIATMISSWVENDKQLTILNLSGIPYKVIDVVIGVISNLIFDVVYYSLKINQNYEGRPLLICFEEAHKYLKSNTQTSYSQQAVERIMKEGRKFGIGAMIISQRPVEIPNSIISQVSTFIALRLTNSEDQSKISSFAPNNFGTFLKSFPSLGNGDAFVIGESMKIPMKIKIPLLESVGNINFDKKIGVWTEERKTKFSYINTIERWIQK